MANPATGATPPPPVLPSTQTTETSQTQSQTAIAEAASDPPNLSRSAVLVAFMAIFESVQILRTTIANEADQLRANATAQDRLVNEEYQYRFEVLPKKGHYSQEEVQTLTRKNTLISAFRNEYQNRLTILKQDSQQKQAKQGASVNLAQQALTQGTGLMKLLGDISRQILR